MSGSLLGNGSSQSRLVLSPVLVAVHSSSDGTNTAGSVLLRTAPRGVTTAAIRTEATPRGCTGAAAP